MKKYRNGLINKLHSSHIFVSIFVLQPDFQGEIKLECKNDKTIQLINELEAGRIKYSLSPEERKSLELSLNEAALNGQFDFLYRLIPKMYESNQIATLGGYDYTRWNDENRKFFDHHKVLIWAIVFGYGNVVFNYLDIESIEPHILHLAIHLAIAKMQTDIVVLLLDDDRLDVYQKGFSCGLFEAAIRNSDLRTITCLLQDDRLRPNTEDAFILACALGEAALVELLIPYYAIKPEMTIVLKHGLNAALNNKRTETLKVLLNEESIDPDKVLLEVSIRGHAEIVQYLLENNKKINPATQKSRALRLAVQNSHLEVVQLFLKDGRIQPQALGNLAIRIAAGIGNAAIVSCLLADPRVRPEARQNDAIRNAVKNYCLDAIKLLMEHEAVDLDVLVKCAASYKDTRYKQENSIVDIFKIIVKNKRVNFEKALDEVYQDGVYYQHDKKAVIKLIIQNFSLEQLMRHLPKFSSSFRDDKTDIRRDSISRNLVSTLGIFSMKHTDLTQEIIPKEVNQIIGQLMIRSCSPT